MRSLSDYNSEAMRVIAASTHAECQDWHGDLSRRTAPPAIPAFQGRGKPQRHLTPIPDGWEAVNVPRKRGQKKSEMPWTGVRFKAPEKARRRRRRFQA